MYVKRILPNGVRLITERIDNHAHDVGRHLGRQRQPIRTRRARRRIAISSST